MLAPTYVGTIGSGTYGTVYAVESTAGPLAVKVLNGSRTSNFYRSMARECFGSSQANLNLGMIYDGLDFGVLQPLLGASVCEGPRQLHYPTCSPAVFATAFRPLVCSLSAWGGMHRDIKPANIVWPNCENGHATLLDFSLATIDKTSCDDHVVSNWYRAPEVVMGHYYTSKIDVWAFGIVMLNLLTGRQFCKVADADIDGLMTSIFSSFGGLDEFPLAKEWMDRRGLSVAASEDPFEGLCSEAMELARMCLRTNPEDRASWTDVIKCSFWKLAGTVKVPRFPPNVRPLRSSSVSHFKTFLEFGVVYLPDEKPVAWSLKDAVQALDTLAYAAEKLGISYASVSYAFALLDSSSSIAATAACLFLASAYRDAPCEDRPCVQWVSVFGLSCTTQAFKHCVGLELLRCAGQWPSARLEWPERLGPFELPSVPWASLEFEPQDVCSYVRTATLRSNTKSRGASV